VLYQVISLLHDLADPLIARPTLGLYAIYLAVALLTLSADTVAIGLGRKAS
jgi:hypothetical protein